jgi:putative membrane protein
MYAGIPCVYSTFFGYDEVAHHSGIERPDAIEVLNKLDEQFDRLEKMSRFAPRPYKFVVLSDHGQSQGATFKQRYGMTLEDLVRSYVSREHTVESIESQDAAWGNLGVFFTDILNDIIPRDDHLIAQLFRRAVEPYRQFNQIVLGPYRKYWEAKRNSSTNNYAEIVVLASGNLGLIYFTEWKERLSYEKIEQEFPNLIHGLTQHEGIGFVMVRSDEFGPLAIAKNGIYYLLEGQVKGENPLQYFSPNAAAHLLRTDSFPHVPDILVNSLYDPETDEVAAFEELVGSHGGLGGGQTAPFILFPSEWEIENSNIVGAGELHTQMKNWLPQYLAK